jgi:hypothetical protein
MYAVYCTRLSKFSSISYSKTTPVEGHLEAQQSVVFSQKFHLLEMVCVPTV